MPLKGHMGNMVNMKALKVSSKVVFLFVWYMLNNWLAQSSQHPWVT